MIRLIAAPPDAVLPGGTIDAQKGYPTADDTPEGRAHLTAHQSLSEVPLTIYRVRRDATWWVIVPDGTTLLTTLPGDIPGLLRRGSPCVDSESCRSIVVDLEPAEVAYPGTHHTLPRAGLTPWPIAALALDLNDPTGTGRAHAAWWCNERAQTFLWPTDPRGEDEAVMLACLGGDMTPEQVDTLARLVLRFAGRTA